jgi:formate hydrogenlyase subunit 4
LPEAAMIRTSAYNAIQVLFIVIFAPLYAGVLSRFKEIVQSRRGPSIVQPYRDIWKLFQKDEIISDQTTWIFRLAPYLVFITPIFVAILIPVLTDYPLAFAFMGDMLAGGFFLGIAGFFAALAAIDTGNPYGPMGASRTRMVGFLAEPVFMIVFFTVSFVAQSTIPFIVQQKWIASVGAFFSPAHILLLIAFLMLILAEGGRIPVDNPTGHFELAMIDESKGLEYSGRGAALMRWGGQMKFLVLACIYLNVLVAPWGLAHGASIVDVLVAIPAILLKLLIFTCILVAIESSLSKLRLFRISEFLGAAFITAVAAMVTSIFPGTAQ